MKDYKHIQMSKLLDYIEEYLPHWDYYIDNEDYEKEVFESLMTRLKVALSQTFLNAEAKQTSSSFEEAYTILHTNEDEEKTFSCPHCGMIINEETYPLGNGFCWFCYHPLNK